MPESAVSPDRMASAGLCIGCGACAEAGAMRWDRHGHLKPAAGRKSPPGFRRTCPFSPEARDEDALAAALFPDAPYRDAQIGRFEAAWVGHAGEGDFRAGGSSGGLVSWAAVELLRRGLVDGVAHVVPTDPAHEGRLFGYRISRSETEVRAGAKSRYYPVELSAVLDEMRDVPGRYALVAIPCFVKAARLACLEEPRLRERLAFTLGLFCGHMKSAHMVESFAWQLGARADEVAAIDYRAKDPSRPANWYRARLTLKDGSERSQDWWHLADGDWGAGFFQNAACDWCDDVTAETADIAFGDAWVEPYSSDGRGTNVVVARSQALAALIRDGIAAGRLALEPVEADFVVATQAAGLRHRREGLGWRLAHRRGPLPSKRVAPDRTGLRLRRRLVYRMRRHIAAASRRMFALARRLRTPRLYTGWARFMLGLYQAVAWSRGPLGSAIDRLEKGAAALRARKERNG